LEYSSRRRLAPRFHRKQKSAKIDLVAFFWDELAPVQQLTRNSQVLPSQVDQGSNPNNIPVSRFLTDSLQASLQRSFFIV
jgi:hypothetical protein